MESNNALTSGDKGQAEVTSKPPSAQFLSHIPECSVHHLSYHGTLSANFPQETPFLSEYLPITFHLQS